MLELLDSPLLVSTVGSITVVNSSDSPSTFIDSGSSETVRSTAQGSVACDCIWVMS